MQEPKKEPSPDGPFDETEPNESPTIPLRKHSEPVEETRIHTDTSEFTAIPREKFSLPKQVEQVDPNATLIYTRGVSVVDTKPTSPADTKPNTTPAKPAPAPTKPVPPPYKQAQVPYKPAPYVPSGTGTPRRLSPKKRGGSGGPNFAPSKGCLTNGAILGLFGLILLIILGSISAVVGYFIIATTLPSVDDLKTRSAQFETTRILDRNGNMLYEILDPNAGRRTYVKISEISPMLVAATIATEDKEFYNHPGFDPLAILQAMWTNVTSQGNGPGASTITQQLARALLLSPEERVQRSYLRKIREIILAAEITRQYSKDEILELYLNEIYYGNLAYGIEAAAATYFGAAIDGQATEFNPQGTPANGRLADDLNLAQAGFLAGLPQSPAIYDIYTNRDLTLSRNRDVLSLMYLLSEEQNCIYVSNWSEEVCVSIDSALAATTTIENYNFPTPDVTMRYPHWVNYIRSQLESQFDAQTIYRSGFTVTTTLDATLQDIAQRSVSDQITLLYENNARNGALVAIKPSTSEILAMVGSADFYNESIQGQVNMATTETRQPGSAIKPLTYLAAFEKGWTPATLIWDVPSKFPPSGNPNDPGEPYQPVNYDGRFHGPVTIRSALANSYNIPAVKALNFIGVYDNPNTPEKDGLIGMAERLGITSFTRDDYGLALTLGGGEVSLLQMTEAFGVLANKGAKQPTVSILKISDHLGNLIYEYQPTPSEQVVSPENAYLISSILSDYAARRPMFGGNPVINLPFYAPVAAKTGTTNDFRDNWTMGYSPDIAVGVWVGNADYTAMVNSTGLTGAGPIWASFMTQAIPLITGGEPTMFERPAGIVERVVCKISGTEPSKWCPEEAYEVFAANNLPPSAEHDLWKKVFIDKWTGLIANNFCEGASDEVLTFNVQDESAQKWIRKTEEGKDLARQIGFDDPIFFTPSEACDEDTELPKLSIENIQEGAVLTEMVINIAVVVDSKNKFSEWRLELGPGFDPSDEEWETLFVSTENFRQPTEVFPLLLQGLGFGPYTLRLTIENETGGKFEKVVHFENNYIPPTDIPTPTAEPTATVIVFPTFTSIPPTVAPTVEFPTPTDLPTAAPTGVPTTVP